MKKLLLTGSIAALLLPYVALAATGDVTLDTTVVLSVNGITLNVSGSTASLDTIEVGSSTFTITLAAGSSFEVTAPNLNKLSASDATWQSANTCTGSLSKLGYNATGGSVTVTISPSSDLCTDTTSTDTSSPSHGDARGGGGGAATVTTPVTPVVTPDAKAAAITAIKTQLISLIQQLIVLLNKQLSDMKANGSY